MTREELLQHIVDISLAEPVPGIPLENIPPWVPKSFLPVSYEKGKECIKAILDEFDRMTEEIESLKADLADAG